jgi:hypothetical protein
MRNRGMSLLAASARLASPWLVLIWLEEST